MESVVEIAKLMQEAALDPTQWEAALNAVSSFAGSSGAVLLSVEARRKFAPTSSDIAEMMNDYFQSGWYANDRREACIPLLKKNGVVFDFDFQSEQEIENCDFYSALLSRHRRKWFAGVGVATDGDYWCLAFQRKPHEEPFGPSDYARLQKVREILFNTAILAKRIGDTWISGLQNALRTVGRAAVLLDKDARVLELNDAAGQFLRTFIHGDRHIRLGSAEATAALDALLTRTLSGSLYPHDQVIAIGKERYRCQGLNLTVHRDLIACKAAAVLLFDQPAEVPQDVMRRRYGLTAAEARTALALSDGKTVQEISDGSMLKADTIRCYLKSVYRKTDVRTQAQLVALVRSIS